MDGPDPTHVLILLRWLKEGPAGAIPIADERCSLGTLQAVTWEDAGDPVALIRLADWHHLDNDAGRSGSRKGVRRWLTEEVLSASDRLLFWVKDARGQAVGCVGLRAVNLHEGTVVLREPVGTPDVEPTLLRRAGETLQNWAAEALNLREVSLPSRRAEFGGKRSA